MAWEYEWAGAKAAHEAAVSGDGEAYLQALRGYCRTGRAVALQIRKGAA